MTKLLPTNFFLSFAQSVLFKHARTIDLDDLEHIKWQKVLLGLRSMSSSGN